MRCKEDVRRRVRNMRKWWKQPEVIGASAYFFFKALGKTLRLHIEKDRNINPDLAYLFGFWHGKQLLPSLIMHAHHQTRLCAMVSPSRDGAMLARYLQKCGFEIIRGSSRDNNVSALIQIKKKLRQGISTGFGIDGPIGPIYTAKPGIVYLAQKCDVPIVPVGSAFQKTWIFEKAWDKFALPFPFTRAGLVLGEPFSVAKTMDIEQAREELESRLQVTEQRAKALIS